MTRTTRTISRKSGQYETAEKANPEYLGRWGAGATSRDKVCWLLGHAFIAALAIYIVGFLQKAGSDSWDSLKLPIQTQHESANKPQKSQPK